MTLYQIDLKSLADMNNHIWWQISKKTGHISSLYNLAYTVLRSKHDKEYQPKVLSQAQCPEVTWDLLLSLKSFS